LPFIGFYQGNKHLQAVSIGSTGFSFEEAVDFCKSNLIILFSFDRFDILSYIPQTLVTSIRSYSVYNPMKRI